MSKIENKKLSRYNQEECNEEECRNQSEDAGGAKRKDAGGSRKGRFSAVIDWAGYFLIVIAVTFVINTYVGQRTYISGPSMQPMLHDGDNLIVDKISYRFTDPKRYDIVVFPYQYLEETFYIKRIIGLPGETVQIKDGYIYINGELLDEHYGAEIIHNPGIAAEPIVLGEDEYFMLGDNRNHSTDSREIDVGPVKRENLIGKAWMRIWPLDKFGVIRHE